MAERDRERRRLGHQIADLAQEGLIVRLIDRLAGARLMPGVDLRLQIVALRQQRPVARGEAGEEIAARRARRSAQSMPVPGSASCSMKSASSAATDRPARSTISAHGRSALRREAGSGDAGKRGDLVIVGRVAGDAHRADGAALSIDDDDRHPPPESPDAARRPRRHR